MKITHALSFLIFVLGITTFFSCSEGGVYEEPKEIKGYDYYPLEIGKYIVYRMDSVVYTQNEASQIHRDTTSSYLKEVIVDTLRDNENKLLYRIERYYRNDTNTSWDIYDVVTEGLYPNQAIRTEDNRRFVKLAFPLDESTIWDGNQFFNETDTVFVKDQSLVMFDGWNEYYVDNIDQQEIIGDYIFDSVATIVNAISTDNLIQYRTAFEKYAKNIGLVYREVKILDTQTIDQLSPWEEKAEKGFILRQTIIDHN